MLSSEMICTNCKEKLKKMYLELYRDLDHFSDFPLVDLEKDEKRDNMQEIETPMTLSYCHNF